MTIQRSQVQSNGSNLSSVSLARASRVGMRALLAFAMVASPVLVAACNTKDSSTTTKAAPSATSSASALPSAAASATPDNSDVRLIPPPADVAAAPADAEKLPSGLASKVLQAGTGKDHPKPEDFVKVHYTGWTKAGRMFDTSITENRPADFRLNEVIKGWTDGVALMVVGEKRRLWIPAAMAYGEQARGGAPAGDLVFDVELLEIKPGPKPPTVPEDVKAAPATAKKTASGLAYRILKSVKDGARPKETDRVEVNYSGWTTDGKMFDSSVMRGRTATFGLNGVIKGWTEGLQLMKVGETARFWIPGKLAYGDTPTRPGAPAGTLVFDVELIAIK